MPIVKNVGLEAGLWVELKDLGVLSNVEQMLPDPTATGDLMGGDSRLQAEWGTTTIGMQQAFGRHALAGVATNIGFPKGHIFNAATSLMTDTDPSVTLWDKIRSQNGSRSQIEGMDIMKGFSKTGDLAMGMQGAFGDALAAVGHITELAGDLVPIIGGVVKTLSKVISFFWRESQKKDPEFFVQPAQFSREDDNRFANQNVLEPVRSTLDWTNVWSPPGLGFGPQQGTGFAVTTVKDNHDQNWGVRIQAHDGGMKVASEKWSGGIPKTGNIDLGWEVSTSGQLAQGTRSLGSLLPTARDQMPKVWSMALKPGAAACFSIDANELRKRWLTYLVRLRLFLQGTDRLSDTAKANFINGEAKVDFFQWKSFSPGLDVSNMKSSALYAAFGLTEESLLFQSITELESIQNANVNSVACAYATEGFAALRPGQPLHSKFKQNRIDLLEHQAVCQVDLNSVPDLEYRLAVKANQDARNCDALHLSSGPFKPNAPKSPPPSQGLNGLISAQRVGGGGSGALLIAAAMLGLIVMKNKR